MKKNKHKVELTAEDRQTLETLVCRGEHNALEIRRAHILLKADANGPAWTDAKIAEAFGCHEQTVYNVRKRWTERGGLPALKRKLQSRPSRWSPKLDGQGEARLIALACSDPPEGFSQWTLQLLADQLVELEIVESIALEAVRQTLKKNAGHPHREQAWVIPPDEDEAFVAAMEAVLDVDQRPEDAALPVVAMDERPVQLLGDLRAPIPAKPGQTARRDTDQWGCDKPVRRLPATGPDFRRTRATLFFSRQKNANDDGLWETWTLRGNPAYLVATPWHRTVLATSENRSPTFSNEFASPKRCLWVLRDKGSQLSHDPAGESLNTPHFSSDKTSTVGR